MPRLGGGLSFIFIIRRSSSFEAGTIVHLGA